MYSFCAVVVNDRAHSFSEGLELMIHPGTPAPRPDFRIADEY
jgi:hypothetical protein